MRIYEYGRIDFKNCTEIDFELHEKVVEHSLDFKNIEDFKNNGDYKIEFIPDIYITKDDIYIQDLLFHNNDPNSKFSGPFLVPLNYLRKSEYLGRRFLYKLKNLNILIDGSIHKIDVIGITKPISKTDVYGNSAIELDNGDLITSCDSIQYFKKISENNYKYNHSIRKEGSLSIFLINSKLFLSLNYSSIKFFRTSDFQLVKEIKEIYHGNSLNNICKINDNFILIVRTDEIALKTNNEKEKNVKKFNEGCVYIISIKEKKLVQKLIIKEFQSADCIFMLPDNSILISGTTKSNLTNLFQYVYFINNDNIKMVHVKTYKTEFEQYIRVLRCIGKNKRILALGDNYISYKLLK